MRLWHLFALLALIGLAYAVRSLVTEGLVVTPDATGGTVAFLLTGTAAVALARRSRRHRAHDDSGPVPPAPMPSPPASAAGGRWSIREIAGTLAHELRDTNPVVTADERSRTVRIMLDPPSAITLRTPQRRVGGDTRPDGPYHAGEWWEVTWREGRPPKVSARTSVVDARPGPDGSLVPVWGGTTGPSGRRSRFTAAAVRGAIAARPVAFEITSTQLVDLIDRIAVRSGWASEAQVARGSRDTVPALRRSVVRGGARPVARERTDSAAADRGPRPGGFVLSPEEAAHALREQSETAARLQAQVRAGTAAGFGRAARVMTWIGAALVLACVLATGIGLMAGMVWWASFIIIGSALLFCAVFVLPVVLIARYERAAGQGVG